MRQRIDVYKRQTEHSALTKLRRNPVLNRFHEEVITYHSYTDTGFAAWKHSGSVEECLIEYLDAKGTYLYGGAVQQKESTQKLTFLGAFLCLDVTKKIPCLKIHPIFCLLF